MASGGEPVPVDDRVSAVSVFEDLPTAVYGVSDVRRSLKVFAWLLPRIKWPPVTVSRHGRWAYAEPFFASVRACRLSRRQAGSTLFSPCG